MACSTDFSARAAASLRSPCCKTSRQAHATSIAIILPLSLVSLAVYYLNGNLELLQGLPFFLPALLGSACGAWGLQKIPVPLLKLLFSLLILYSALRMVLG